MEIRLPRLGEGADTGSVVSVLVKEGDQIKKDQTLIELENEKAVAPIPSPASGSVAKIHIKVGDKISVGQLILTLAVEGPVAAPTAAQKEIAHSVKQESSRRTKDIPVAGRKIAVKSVLGPAAAPSIRKMARDIGIDLDRVAGSGQGGRILPEDLRVYVARLQEAEARGGAAPARAAVSEQIDFSKWGPVTRKVLSGLRKTISHRMTDSWTTIPHVYQFDEADITDLLELIKKHEVVYEKKGVKLTLTVLVLKIVAGILKNHPKFNASLDEVAEEIVTKEYVHIGVAVDTEAGLMVPVIRDVEKKSFLDIARELADLAEKAKSRKVSAEQLQGGSFTISNQGGIGGGYFTPIIKKPEAAILGLGRGKFKPVVRNGKIEARVMLPLCLSYDHRIADGADAARCIRDLVAAIGGFKGERLVLTK